MNEKRVLRALFTQKLASLSLKKKMHASQAACDFLFSHLPSQVLSFSSKASEIDLTPLNHLLAREGRLLLPKMEGASLALFRVVDIAKQTALHPFGFLEPIPERCEKGSPDLILVPALCFDSHNHRLGYGKGCYDRLLSLHSLPTWGIGFKEQLIDSLPIEEHDQRLSSICLF